MKTWIPDEETYQTIQELKTYVSFISNLEQATKTDKEKAKEILFLIENINKPDTHKPWNVCLHIYNEDILYGYTNEEGVYSRKWMVYFEKNEIELEAITNHTNHEEHHGDDFNYYACIILNKNDKGQRVNISNSITEFVNDAQHYKSYITKTLNEIEIDIDIW